MATVRESVSHGLALGLDNGALLWAGTPHPQHSPAPTPLERRAKMLLATLGCYGKERFLRARGRRKSTSTRFLASSFCSSEDPKGGWSAERWCWEDRVTKTSKTRGKNNIWLEQPAEDAEAAERILEEKGWKSRIRGP